MSAAPPVPYPPASPGDPASPEARLAVPQGGDAEVATAFAEREGRLSADEAQLRMPFDGQPHGQAIRT